MRTTSTNCNDSSLAYIGQFVAGALLVAGFAAVVWMLSRRGSSSPDPVAEIDRRINDLEHSLSRLKDVFGDAVGG